jgi:hypothetical protein
MRRVADDELERIEQELFEIERARATCVEGLDE